jgi:hypothetical protein
VKKLTVALLVLMVFLAACSSGQSGQGGGVTDQGASPAMAKEELKDETAEAAAIGLEDAMIEFDDKIENMTAVDGTKNNLFFTMKADHKDGVFTGQAMLAAAGVKDVGGDIPATAGMQYVAKVEFSLQPVENNKTATVGDMDIAPLVKKDWSGSGNFHFILTDVGFMALEAEVDEEDALTVDVPFEISVFGSEVAVSFEMPDSEPLRFKGKIIK